ncbi:MAG: diversity-generating retroelement protein Avd [Chloroflexi bacterium]|nr:diversity-generating retroelement protein Avd [Chloroflexota bacterium]
MTRSHMVIFTRTYDLLTWLLPHCERFPRAQRFVVTKRLQDAALDFQERIIEANALPVGPVRLERLQTADGDLGKLKLYLRLAFRWGWLTEQQYEFVSEQVAEIGKLLGGWMKQTKRA